jgi:Fe/S biogenesis protein NfuA
MATPLLALDPAAARKLSEMRDAGRFDGSALRVSVREHGATFRYALELVDAGSRAGDDEAIELEGIHFYVDPASAPLLRGSTLEYKEDLSGGGFRFENPNRPRLLANPLAERVQRLLDDEINPAIAAHGGRVGLVALEGARAVLEFGGGCQGCGMVDVTLREGVAARLHAALPEISEVVDATDHAAGESPYYPR